MSNVDRRAFLASILGCAVAAPIAKPVPTLYRTPLTAKDLAWTSSHLLGGARGGGKTSASMAKILCDHMEAVRPRLKPMYETSDTLKSMLARG